jgi:ubiquinone/menaquinone biosynthesis C-methylase UbiE
VDDRSFQLEVEEARIREVYAKRSWQSDLRYSWFNAGHVFMMQERERRILMLLREYDRAALETRTILEVGCGTGYWLREFIKWGAQPEHIAGIDLLPDRAAEARRLCPQAVRIYCGSAGRLPFSDAAFDLVLQSTVLTSVLNAQLRQEIASEMLRVVKDDGLILWYDYHIDNPWNSDVRGVKRSEINRLFAGCHIKLRRITLAPPLARRLAPYSWALAHVLERIPLLCTHYLGIIRKPERHD